jgi:succinylglutamate desuccinylase
LLANPKAIEANRRYLNRDLNRCFDKHDLANLNLTGYENNLAKEIAARFGVNGTEPVDAIIDLHSTTANMGTTIIPISHSPVNLMLADYLNDLDPVVHVYLGLHSQQDSPMLRSLAPLAARSKWVRSLRG